MDVSQDLGPAHVGPGPLRKGSFFGREIPETIQEKNVKYDNLARLLCFFACCVRACLVRSFLRYNDDYEHTAACCACH